MQSEVENVNQEVTEPQNVVDTPEVVDYKALYEETNTKLSAEIAKITALENKKNELLGETKAAKDAKRQTEVSTADELRSLKESIKTERITNKSLSMAAELAEGTDQLLLKAFIERELSSIADENGHVSDEDYKKTMSQFETNPMYAKLMKQSKAGGGGAPGQASTVSAGNSAKRSDFNTWDNARKAAFFKAGGSLTE